MSNTCMFQGVYEAWQATGDDGWMRGHLEPMRRAVTYSLQHPLRWDAERGLIRRPFTIDTWDFEYGPHDDRPGYRQASAAPLDRRQDDLGRFPW
jgi:hypothetical protein